VSKLKKKGIIKQQLIMSQFSSMTAQNGCINRTGYAPVHSFFTINNSKNDSLQTFLKDLLESNQGDYRNIHTACVIPLVKEMVLAEFDNTYKRTNKEDACHFVWLTFSKPDLVLFLIDRLLEKRELRIGEWNQIAHKAVPPDSWIEKHRDRIHFAEWQALIDRFHYVPGEGLDKLQRFKGPNDEPLHLNSKKSRQRVKSTRNQQLRDKYAKSTDNLRKSMSKFQTRTDHLCSRLNDELAWCTKQLLGIIWLILIFLPTEAAVAACRVTDRLAVRAHMSPYYDFFAGVATHYVDCRDALQMFLSKVLLWGALIVWILFVEAQFNTFS
jgi:hypothetical protein